MSLQEAAATADLRLRRLEDFFDLEAKGEGDEFAEIRDYYRDSALGYRFVHSREGAMHMALSKDGSFKEEDYLGQAEIVARNLEDLLGPEVDNGKVLELACGAGFNLFNLSEWFPDIEFAGIDLSPAMVEKARRRLALRPNVSVIEGNFQVLPFEDGAFDLAFSVESLCHATNSSTALSEARRVLRPGGRLIVVDAWRTDSFSSTPDSIQRAAGLVEAAMAVHKAQEFPRWLATARSAGFEVIEDLDETDAVMPNLLRLQRIADKFLAKPLRARIMKFLLPETLLRNAIAGYLMPVTVSAGAHEYRAVTLRAI